MFPIQYFTDVIDQALPPPYSSLLNGITYGRSIGHLGSLYDAFRKSGLLHIMVLSGSNIALLGAILESLLSFLPKRFAVVVIICFIVAFAISVGLEPPTLRATIMGSLSLLATLFHRKAIAIYSLVITCLIMLAFQPTLATNVSFLLSAGATLGITLFGTASGKERWWYPEELRITLAAQVFTTPVIFLYFRQISLISPLANLAISMVVGPLMVLGFMISIVGRVSLACSLPLAWLAEGMLKYIVFVTTVSQLIPYSSLQF